MNVVMKWNDTLTAVMNMNITQMFGYIYSIHPYVFL